MPTPADDDCARVSAEKYLIRRDSEVALQGGDQFEQLRLLGGGRPAAIEITDDADADAIGADIVHPRNPPGFMLLAPAPAGLYYALGDGFSVADQKVVGESARTMAQRSGVADQCKALVNIDGVPASGFDRDWGFKNLTDGLCLTHGEKARRGIGSKGRRRQRFEQSPSSRQPTDQSG